MKKNYFLILFIYFIVAYNPIFCQKDQGYLEVKGTVKVDREGLGGARVNVYKNGVQEIVVTTDDNGKFDLKLDLNKEYDLVFTKQGYFLKKLFFNTKVPKEDVGIWNYKFAIELIPSIDGFDASLFNEPIGKFEFSSQIGDFDYDEVYTANMQKRIKALMREYEKAKREAYNKLVAQADDYFNKKQYDEAIEIYDKAVDLDPYDPYPDDQIYMIGRIIQKDENAQKNYQKNIQIADQNFQVKDYLNAKKYYNRALKYLNEKYPKEQIDLCDKFMDEPQDDTNDKAYNLALAAADRSYDAKQYPSALAKYTEASGIKPNESYPKERIAELNDILAQLEGDKKAKEELERAYQAAITAADAGFNSKNYTTAKSNYEKASQLKPAEQYPRTRLTEIENLLAANKSLDEKYKGFIAVADQSFNAQQYESAKTNYQQALSIKPGEAYPTNKIKEIDALLLQLAQNKQKEKEAAYQRAISQADAAFNQKTYDAAKTNYNLALSIKTNESYPKQKLAEIDQILAEIANKKRAYDLAIARADNSFNVEKWSEAKVDYQEALNLFPNEQYPQTRINEIENKLLAMKNAEEQKLAREKAYQEAIAQADARFNEKKYVESKNFYTQAGSVKPSETYPKQKIEEIDRILAAEKALNERYNQIIATADNHFVDENWQDAKDTYTNALQLKPAEAYPKEKIAAIDAKLTQMMAQKVEREKTEKAYNEIIAQADAQFNQKSWEQAKTLYQKALIVIPDEVYPKQRIVEIDNTLASIADKNRRYNEAIQKADVQLAQKAYGEALSAYTLASQIKPEEAYPKQKITEINSILADARKNQAAYDNFIQLADAAYSKKELENAKIQYQSALSLKPNESYPQQRITEIDKLIAEQMRLQQAKDALNAKYKELITSADNAFNMKNYQAAKSDYTQASGLKPEESYPKEKLSEIDNVLAALSAKQKSYDEKMQQGAGLFAEKNYNGALAAYQQASQIKPDEGLPKQKITEIQNILAAASKKQEQYNQLIGVADGLFNQNKLADAKPVYQQALQILPNEAYPKNQMSRIDQLIADAAKRDADLKAQLKAYNDKIQEADRSFQAKSYNEAITAYNSAKTIKPDETYPDQQITRINALIKAEATQLEASFNEAIKNGDALKVQKKYEDARQQYLTAQQLKPDNQIPKNKLVELQNLMDKERLALEQQAKLDREYNDFVTQADKAYKLNDYASAIALYNSALGLKPSEKYPKDQIEICDRKMKEQKALAAADEEKRKQEELAAAKHSFDGKEFDYSGEKRDQKFLNDLAKQYPEGVTVENYDKKNKKIKRVIVNHGGIAKEYVEVTYSYGTFYFRNGQNISRSIFYSETKN